MFVVSLHFGVVLVAAAMSMIIGGIWYSPLWLGPAWVKAMGLSSKSVKQKQRELSKLFLLSFVEAIVVAIALGIMLKTLGAVSLSDGLLVGGVLWFGFCSSVQFLSWLFSGKDKALYFIDTAYQLVIYLVMSSILTLWG